VAPADDFSARVRARVQTESKPASGWQSGWWLAAAAGVALTIIGIREFRSGEAPSPVVPAPRVEVARVPEPSAPVAAVVSQSSAPRHVSQAIVPVVRVAAVTRPEPEILIAPDQAVAFAQLMGALNDGRIDRASLGGVEIVPFEVVLAPQVVPTLIELPKDPPGGGNGAGKGSEEKIRRFAVYANN